MEMVLGLGNVVREEDYGIGTLLHVGTHSTEPSDGGNTTSPTGLALDATHTPLESKATHEPITLKKGP